MKSRTEEDGENEERKLRRKRGKIDNFLSIIIAGNGLGLPIVDGQESDGDGDGDSGKRLYQNDATSIGDLNLIRASK